MLGKRQILYIIVSDYPYGFGEPFLEDELAYISDKFTKVYIVIPESHRIDKSHVKFKVPANAEILEFNISITASDKLKSAIKWLSPAWVLEREFIRKHYKHPFSLLHLKLMLAYEAYAAKSADALEKHIYKKGYSLDEVSLYTYWFSNVSYALAKLKHKFPQLRAITRAHRWDCFYYVNPSDYLPFRPWMAKYLDGIYPISDAGSFYLKEKLAGLFDSKIITYRLGVDIQTQIPERSKKGGNLNVVSIAFISRVKRIDRIVEALSLMNNVNINWTHIGSAPKDDKQVEELASESLSSNVHVNYSFLGERSKQEVLSFLRSNQVDVLLCTSESEGIPVSMMEALAHGIPVISLNVGGISELVNDKYNGTLLPEHATVQDIAQALHEWAYLSEIEYQQFSRRAYESYLTYFSAQNNYTTFYAETLQA